MIATTTVPHRGGSGLHLPRNRRKNVLDRIDHSCYGKTLKKRFLINSQLNLSTQQTDLTMHCYYFYLKSTDGRTWYTVS
jgi:hypothetical protein